MIAVGIRYLTGYAVSSDGTRRSPEFPPHVGRIFMALTAAHFESRGDARERRALEWIEQQSSAPSMRMPEFSARKASSGRSAVETYVPVNDRHGGIVGRSRQARSFPTARLSEDSLFLMWDADPPDDIRIALDGLCTKVTRIGHSSSLVQMWVVSRGEEIVPNLIPDDFVSGTRMRVPEPGTLDYLERTFRRGERPRLGRWQGYRAPRQENVTPPLRGVFDPRLIVLEKSEGRMLGLESTLQLTSALRNAAMKALPEGQSPEWLSGHQVDGTPSAKPHVAFLPLPFVDARHADGHVMGMAMAIPRDVPAEEARRAIGALLFDPESGAERRVHLWKNDRLWDWYLERETRDRPPVSLRAETWTEASCVWASVTPVVLHHYPKKNRDGDVERILYEAFASAGLPKPKQLRISAASVFEGALHARGMPEFAEGGEGLCRYQVHAVAVFEHCLEGPVLVGRGRYRGYGLFRPVRPSWEGQ